ncbi:hypothetical protein D3C87_1731870 [compost metagenome]
MNKSKASANDILGLMCYLLGKEIADMLDIKVSELPAYKLLLIKVISFLKNFKSNGDSRGKYYKAYAAFKMQRPELINEAKA